MDKKKKSTPHLTLNRETVRRLSEPELIEAHGGATELKRSCGVPYTHCPLCDPIT